MLFEEKQRTLEGGIPYGMGPYDYLDQSARPEAEKVRSLIEQMLNRYPRGDVGNLLSRLRINEEITHNAAFLELCLHELLLRRNFKVEGVELEAPGTTKRPDYLVQSPSGIGFFLEATTASGESSSDRGAQKRLDAVFDVLSKVIHPHFRVAILGAQAPKSPVNGRKLRHQVIAWLNSLDPSTVSNANAPTDDICPRDFAVTIGEFTMSLRAVRRSTDSLAPPGIAFISYPLRAVAPGDAIRSKVFDKASRYGRELGRPYVIAVNSTQVLQRDEHFEQAVFGTLEYSCFFGDADAEVETVRRSDGLWLQGNGPRYRRVSGVLCFSKLTPWSLGTVQARFIENPFAEHPLSFAELGLPTVRVEGEKILSFEGLSVAELLELPQGWPE